MPARVGRAQTTAEPGPPVGDLRAGVDACTRCPLFRNATQGVPGEGPPGAALMLVGEQPGDQEDIAGRPFVGPAGKMLWRLASEAGLTRADLYVTNAVKHFKFEPRGRRRIHRKPNAGEIQQCRWWLGREIERIRPRLLVALGGSAAEGLTGRAKGLLKRRGSVEEGLDGVPVFLTVHPSYLLRLPDRASRSREEARFRAELSKAREIALT